MEYWKNIDGWERYEVSTDGRIRNKESGCVLQSRANSCGYMRVGLCKHRKQKWVFVHRLVAEAFIANPDNKGQVNHKNGNKTDNRAENLEWVTASENQSHRRKVLMKDGSPKKQVRCVETGVVYPSIHEAARQTNGCFKQISAVCTGKYRTHMGKHWEFV